MPASSKIIALSLLAGASAAPLSLFGSGSASTTATASTAVSAAADINAFANAFINSATGGTVSTVASAAAQLIVVGTSKALAFNAWASGQCAASAFATRDITQCAEISAYLSAVYYAVEQGWTAAQLFAALGESRVAKFQSLLQSICTDAPLQISGTCSTLLGAWPSYVSAMAAVDANTVANAAAQLTSNGIIGLIDTAHIGTAVIANLQASASGAVNTGLNLGGLGLNLGSLNLRDLAEKRAYTDIISGVTGTAAADASAALNAASGISVGQNGIHAVTDIGTQLGANAVAGLTGTVTGLTQGIPVVGNLAAQVGTTANAAVQAAGNANIAGALNVVPGMTSLTGTITGGATTGAGVLGSAHGLLGLRSIPTVGNGLDLDIATSSKEIAEGDVFADAHLHHRDLLSSLPLGYSANGLLNGLPLGSTANGLVNTITDLPVVGNVAAQATGALSSATNVGAALTPQGLTAGVSDVTNVAGDLLGGAGLQLKRSLLNGLPLLGSLPVGNVVNTAESLPLVGGVVNTLTGAVSSIPVVGNVAAQATGALNSATNVGASLTPQGLTAGVSDLTSLAGSLLGGAGLQLKRDPSFLSGLPIVGGLPVVGGLVDTVDSTASSLPVVGTVLNTVGSGVNTIENTIHNVPVVGNIASTAAGLVNGLPIKRDLLSGLPLGGLVNTVESAVPANLFSTVASLPVVGSVDATAQGQASSINNLGLGLTQNGLAASLNGVTGAAGGLLGTGALHI